MSQYLLYDDDDCVDDRNVTIMVVRFVEKQSDHSDYVLQCNICTTKWARLGPKLSPSEFFIILH